MALVVPMRRLLFLASMPWFLFSWTGCTTIKTEHHIVLDHTLTIKLAAEVEDFLDDLYADEGDAVPDESSPPEKK